MEFLRSIRLKDYVHLYAHIARWCLGVCISTSLVFVLERDIVV